MKLKMRNSGIQILREMKDQQQNKQKKMKKSVLVLNHKTTPKNKPISKLLKSKSNNLAIAVMTNTIAPATSKSLHPKAGGHNSNFTTKS